MLASCPEKEKLFCKKKAIEKRRKKAVVRISIARCRRLGVHKGEKLGDRQRRRVEG